MWRGPDTAGDTPRNAWRARLWDWLDERVGYVPLRIVRESSSQEVREAIERLRRRRGKPELLRLASEGIERLHNLVRAGTVFQSDRNRLGVTILHRNTGRRCTDGSRAPGDPGRSHEQAARADACDSRRPRTGSVLWAVADLRRRWSVSAEAASRGVATAGGRRRRSACRHCSSRRFGHRFSDGPRCRCAYLPRALWLWVRGISNERTRAGRSNRRSRPRAVPQGCS